jgi:hypothetical protein
MCKDQSSIAKTERERERDMGDISLSPNVFLYRNKNSSKSREIIKGDGRTCSFL